MPPRQPFWSSVNVAMNRACDIGLFGVGRTVSPGSQQPLDQVERMRKLRRAAEWPPCVHNRRYLQQQSPSQLFQDRRRCQPKIVGSGLRYQANPDSITAPVSSSAPRTDLLAALLPG